MKVVELKISNVPMPNIAERGARIEADKKLLRQVAADIMSVEAIQEAQIKTIKLRRPPYKDKILDRKNVVFTIREDQVDLMTKLSGSYLETTGTTIKIFTTGNNQPVIKSKRFDADETDRQLARHLATQEVEA